MHVLIRRTTVRGTADDADSRLRVRLQPAPEVMEG